MKKQTVWIIFALLAGLCAPLVFAWLIDSNLDRLAPDAGEWARDMLRKKRQLVAERRTRVFLLGGSATLFGFSAAQLTERLGVPCFNLGTHAGLGLDYILHYGEAVIPGNATIILPIEYSLYDEEPSGPARQIQILCHDKEFRDKLPFSERMEMLTAFHWSDRFKFALWRVLPREHRPKDRYNIKDINEFGDETGHMEIWAEAAAMSKRGCGDLKYRLSPKRLRQLADFVATMRARGCEVVVTYPFILEGAIDFEGNEAFFQELRAALGREGIPILGTPRAHVFAEEDAYDTIYHQNTKGARKSTERLAKELREAAKVFIHPRDTEDTEGFR